MSGRRKNVTVRIPDDLLDRLDCYGFDRFGRCFNRSRYISEAIADKLNKQGEQHDCS